MNATQRDNATRLPLPGLKKSVLRCIPAAFVMKPSQKQFLINMTNSGLTNSGSVQIMWPTILAVGLPHSSSLSISWQNNAGFQGRNCSCSCSRWTSEVAVQIRSTCLQSVTIWLSILQFQPEQVYCVILMHILKSFRGRKKNLRIFRKTFRW